MANNVTDLGKVGITMKGEWSSSTTYERLDSVMYDGSLWIALADNTNSTPSINNSNWMLSAKHGEFTEQQLEDFKAEVVAESKEEMDEYTSDKKDELDTYTSGLESDFNTNASSKTTDFNNNATSKTGDFDSNASSKTTAFNTNASDKTTAFNSNATSKTSDFNDNASSKTNAFNSNATNKTTDFNDNASTKTTAFNTNASDKTDAFDSNASDKTDDFNDNATAKTTAFDEHFDDKIDEFDENAESLQQEIDELSANMPWDETEQATSIDITDAAKYSRNKMEVFGNTEQASYQGYNMFSFDYLDRESASSSGITFSANKQNETFAIEGTAEAAAINAYLIGSFSSTVPKFTLPAGTYTFFASNFKLVLYSYDGTTRNAYRLTPNGTLIDIPENFHGFTALKPDNLIAGTSYNETTQIMILKGDYSNNIPPYEPYTNGPAPNPDYPQGIHVVTGNNTVGVTGKNLFDINGTVVGSYQVNKYNNGFILTKASNRTVKFELDADAPAGTYTISYDTINYVHTGTASAFFVSLQDSQNNNIVNNVPLNDTGATITAPDGFKRLYFFISNSQGDEATITIDNVQLEQGSTATSYEPYYHQDYSLNLGSLELCKIENYQDTIFKNTPDSEYYDSSLVENGWYKYGKIGKEVFDGSNDESWSKTNYTFYHTGNYIKTLDAFCSHFTKQNNANWSSSNEEYRGKFTLYNTPEQFKLMPIDTNLDTVTSWRNWLNSNNITLYYRLAEPTATQITDETLISQLETIYNHLALTKGINHITITPQDLAPYVTLNYMQDLPTKLNNLASRIELLEE